MLTNVLIASVVLAASQSLTGSSPLIQILNDMESKNQAEVTTTLNEEVEEKKLEVVKETRWVLRNANQNERIVLKALQERGITDKYALATVLGNIKQESNFHSNICEGGARISYGSCRYGGYGLIQWTSTNRYIGLGRHARSLGMDPSTPEAQISYLFTEPQWRKFEPRLKKSGQSIGYYMNGAYGWLGWGIHGARTYYTNSYVNRLEQKEFVSYVEPTRPTGGSEQS